MKSSQRPHQDPQPESESAAQLKPSKLAWTLWLIAAALLLVVSTALVWKGRVWGWEVEVFRGINNWPDTLYYFFLSATIVPESLWLAAASVIVTFLAKMYRLAWQLATSTFIGYAMAVGFVGLVGRGRPGAIVANSHQRVFEGGAGFPSGHTMMITILVFSLWPHLPKGWRWLVALLVPLMALSRIYLGVHLPLDVVGGFAIGVIAVAVLHVLPASWRGRLHFD